MVFANYHYAPRLQVFFCVFLRYGKPLGAREKGATPRWLCGFFYFSPRTVSEDFFALYSMLRDSAKRGAGNLRFRGRFLKKIFRKTLDKPND